MIALAIAAVGFFLAWRVSLRATYRGLWVLVVALIAISAVIWFGARSPELSEEFSLYPPPLGDAPDMVSMRSAHMIVALGFISRLTAISLAAYGIGAFAGRIAFRWGSSRK